MWEYLPPLIGGKLTGSFLKDFLNDPKGAFSDVADTLINGKTNETNKEVAEQNLEFQKERAGVEDARYQEETEYNRALQERIFEREDTALERQAQSLSSMGINPASQNMSGLGAGSVVGGSPRAAESLHNDFQQTPAGLAQLVAPLMETINSVDNLNTMGIQRDSIRQQINLQKEQENEQKLVNERQKMENLDFAKKHKIKLENGYYTMEDYNYSEQQRSDNQAREEESSANRNQREDKFQETYGGHDSQDRINKIATDTAHQADRAFNGAKQVVGDVAKGVSDVTKKIVDNAKKGWENDKKRWQQSKLNPKNWKL